MGFMCWTSRPNFTVCYTETSVCEWEEYEDFYLSGSYSHLQTCCFLAKIAVFETKYANLVNHIDSKSFFRVFYMEGGPFQLVSLRLNSQRRGGHHLIWKHLYRSISHIFIWTITVMEAAALPSLPNR